MKVKGMVFILIMKMNRNRQGLKLDPPFDSPENHKAPELRINKA
jgi:hypothetical protein